MWNLIRGRRLHPGLLLTSPGDVRDQYVQYFVDFIEAYQAAGVPITAISVQNEPNNVTDYPGGTLTAADQLDFAKRLKAAFAAQSPPLPQQVWAEFGTWEARANLTADRALVDGLAYGRPVNRFATR